MSELYLTCICVNKMLCHHTCANINCFSFFFVYQKYQSFANRVKNVFVYTKKYIKFVIKFTYKQLTYIFNRAKLTKTVYFIFNIKKP